MKASDVGERDKMFRTQLEISSEVTLSENFVMI